MFCLVGPYKPYNCGCGRCTVWSITTRDCPNQKYESLPIVIFVKPNEKSTKERKEDSLWYQTALLVDKFKEAIYTTYEKLQEKGVSIGDVINTIKFYKYSDIIHNDSLLLFLGDNIPWFDCLLVDRLIKHLLKDDRDITEMWAKYKVELTEYANGRIEEYEGIVFGLPATKESVYKCLAIDPEYKMKLSDVSTLRRNICEILDIKYEDLYFYGVQTGSIILTFTLPRSIYKKLFPLSRAQLLELIELGIISLHIENFLVFLGSEEWCFVLNDRPGKNTTMLHITIDTAKLLVT